MATFNFDNFAKNLPDAFRKDTDSNNYKLLLVEKHIYDKIYEMFQSIQNILDLDNTTGATLDMYGERLNVKRGALSDYQYRIRLKAKITQSLCDGTRDSIAEALAYMLSTTSDKIKLETDGTANVVKISDLPLSVVINAEFSTDEITEIVENLLPEGVSVSQTEFTGTFEFAENDNEYDENSGFADLEGTVGGYFGLLAE